MGAVNLASTLLAVSPGGGGHMLGPRTPVGSALMWTVLVLSVIAAVLWFRFRTANWLWPVVAVAGVVLIVESVVAHEGDWPIKVGLFSLLIVVVKQVTGIYRRR
jgi:hypothetical protein